MGAFGERKAPQFKNIISENGEHNVICYSYYVILKRGLSFTKSALYLSDGEFYCLSLGLPLHNVYILEGPGPADKGQMPSDVDFENNVG